MAIEKVREYLKKYSLDSKILEFETSSATVELAAKAVGCENGRIAKSISFKLSDEKCILVVTSGDTKIDNAKFKNEFGVKAKMLSFEEVEPVIGHGVGGVCPFAVNDGVDIFLDNSLKRFESVYPACGSENSCIEIDNETLFKISNAKKWVDVCKFL